MTFKHVKFEDSPTMRALEKVAKEKGLVKPETLQKTASAPKKLDLAPSSNLMENILKLCAGLRDKGLQKEASELETTYLNYKQAQTLYEAHKEKGEDLIHAAHPDGSHKLENVEGDEAVFEDILDQHSKHVQMIEKRPTGKLSNANSIIREVKKALGQDFEAAEKAMIPLRGAKAMEQINSIPTTLNRGKTTVLNKMNTSTLAGSYDTNVSEIRTTIGGLSGDMAPNALIKGIDSIVSDLGDIQNSINFFNWKDIGLLFPGVSTFAIMRHVGDIADIVSGDWGSESRAKLATLINQAKDAAEKARGYVLGNFDEEIKAAQKTTPQAASTDIQSKIQAAQMSLNGIAQLVKADPTADPKDVKEVNDWIARQDAALKDLALKAANMSPEDVQTVLGKITKDFATVRSEWA